jgi:hypothetical protein
MMTKTHLIDFAGISRFLGYLLQYGRPVEGKGPAKLFPLSLVAYRVFIKSRPVL